MTPDQIRRLEGVRDGLMHCQAETEPREGETPIEYAFRLGRAYEDMGALVEEIQNMIDDATPLSPHNL